MGVVLLRVNAVVGTFVFLTETWFIVGLRTVDEDSVIQVVGVSMIKFTVPFESDSTFYTSRTIDLRIFIVTSVSVQRVSKTVLGITVCSHVLTTMLDTIGE